MVKLRWSQGDALPDRKFRWAGGSATGAGGAPKFRWANGSAQGGATLSLRPIPDQSSEPLKSVTITALASGTSPTPSGYIWRQISGPATPFADGGGTITFTAPAIDIGTVVVFGVIAVLGTQMSSEATATVTVLPHLRFRATSDGWIPVTRAALT